MLHSIHHAFQRGQAMVEYAIILIVMTLLVAGGLELAIAAYNGYATIEGAKAGASQWSEYLGRATYSTTSAGFVPKDAAGNHVGLGDHNYQNLSNFRQPSCDPDGVHYDDGLPDGSVTPEESSVTQGGAKVYLYNPLPIDVTSCNGSDGDLPNRSRLSVLISGKGDLGVPPVDNPLTTVVEYAGLPRLNQAVYSQYQISYFSPNASIASGPAFISASSYHESPTGKSRLMRLPGWLDPSDPSATSWLVNIRLDENTNLQTAYGRPVFAIKCAKPFTSSFGACDTESSPLGICWSATGPQACNVQVQYRYRHVFESLVMMGVGIGFGPGDTENEIVNNIDPVLEPFFTDRPVGEDNGYPSDTPAGIFGSEVAITKKENQPALSSRMKARKDFLGCYETSSSSANMGELSLLSTPSDMSWDTGIVTVTMSSAHGLVSGDLIEVEESNPVGFNTMGSPKVVVNITSPTTFTYESDDPGGAFVSALIYRVDPVRRVKVFDVDTIKNSACEWDLIPLP